MAGLLVQPKADVPDWRTRGADVVITLSRPTAAPTKQSQLQAAVDLLRDGMLAALTRDLPQFARCTPLSVDVFNAIALADCAMLGAPGCTTNEPCYYDSPSVAATAAATPAILNQSQPVGVGRCGTTAASGLCEAPRVKCDMSAAAGGLVNQFDVSFRLRCASPEGPGMSVDSLRQSMKQGLPNTLTEYQVVDVHVGSLAPDDTRILACSADAFDASAAAAARNEAAPEMTMHITNMLPFSVMVSASTSPVASPDAVLSSGPVSVDVGADVVLSLALPPGALSSVQVLVKASSAQYTLTRRVQPGVYRLVVALNAPLVFFADEADGSVAIASIDPPFVPLAELGMLLAVAEQDLACAALDANRCSIGGSAANCDWHVAAGCAASDGFVAAATSTHSNGAYRDLVDLQSGCDGRAEAACASGACAWKSATRTCAPSTAAIDRIIAQIADSHPGAPLSRRVQCEARSRAGCAGACQWQPVSQGSSSEAAVVRTAASSALICAGVGRQCFWCRLRRRPACAPAASAAPQLTRSPWLCLTSI